MKKYYYLPAALLLLAACHKSGPEAMPQVVATNFGQDFTLHYQQAATLPPVAPLELELKVQVEELDFSICPENARCFGADFAAPTLALTAADGSQQHLKLGSNSRYATTPAWIDSASVRANGRRYVVYFKSWALAATKSNNPTKQDFTVSLRVEKPE